MQEHSNMIFLKRMQARLYQIWRSPHFFTALTVFYLAGWVFSTHGTRSLAEGSLKVFLLLSVGFGLLAWREKPKRTVWPKPLVWMCVLYPALVYLAVWLQGGGLPRAGAKLYQLPLFFVLLPLCVWGSRFDLGRFDIVLRVLAVLILVWMAYTQVYLGMGRGDVDEVVRTVITYDGMLITLALLGLVCALAQYARGQKKAGLWWTAAACAAVSAVVLHGSRGAWLGIPVALLYLYWAYRKPARPAWRLAAVWLTVFFVWLGIAPNSPLQQRMVAAQQEIAAYGQGDTQSSVGARLTMWRLAWQDFQSAPIHGIGLVASQARRCAARDAGILPQCYTHAHSVYFQELSAHGLLGLSGVLALFGAPLVFFIRRLRSGMLSAGQIQAAHMGVVVVLYTMVASLTDLQIGYGRSLGLYCFLTALLLYWVHEPQPEGRLPENTKERQVLPER